MPRPRLAGRPGAEPVRGQAARPHGALRRPAAVVAAAEAARPAEPGRYRAVIGKQVGEAFTPIGPAQTFQVVPLPEKNYQLYR